MADRPARLRVALVYPPYGPAGLPSLGLALLSAKLRQMEIDCSVFHWNLDVAAAMKGESLEHKLGAYRQLSQRPLLPLNEWVFTGALYGEEAAAGLLSQDALDALCVSQGVSGALREQILDLRSRAAELVAAMADRLSPYPLIGVSSTFFQNIAALALAREVKRRWPDKAVVLGGANCEGEMGKTLLERFPFLDGVFSGEADEAFPAYVAQIARGLPPPELDGLYRRGGRTSLVAGAPAAPLRDLDALPMPDFDDYVEHRARLGLADGAPLCLPLESSRGCWWGARQHCTFCGLNGGGMAFRQKSLPRFLDEVEAIVERYRARFIFMTDNILSTGYPGGLAEWAARRRLGVSFFYEIKANVSPVQMAQLAGAGVNAVQPGIESFSTKTLALMRKGTTGIQNVALLKYAREQGILPVYNILTGFPGEDPEEYRRMAELVPKLVHLRPPTSVPEIEYHRFSPYHTAPERYGIRLRPSPRYAHLYPFPEEVISRLAYFFERDGIAGEDRSYVDPLREQVKRWREHHSDGACALTWRDAGGDVLLRDRRPGFPARVYWLRGHAARVFRRMDQPRGLDRIVADAAGDDEASEALLDALFGARAPVVGGGGADCRVIAFGREQLLADPASCLDRLVSPGLVYCEGGKYLSLAVSVDHRETATGWLSLGV